MKIHEIAVQPRTETGSGAARRARKNGQVPAIVYSKHTEPKQLYLNAGDWASVSRLNSRLLYLVDGDKKQIVLVKEIQMNYLKNYCLHVDFQAVSADEEIHATVALHPFGDSIGVAQGGVLEQSLHELPVQCKPGDLVEEIRVNVENLGFGDRIHVKDIELPAGITCGLDPETLLFHVVAPQEETVAEPAENAPTEPEAIKQKAPAEEEEASDDKADKKKK